MPWYPTPGVALHLFSLPISRYQPSLAPTPSIDDAHSSLDTYIFMTKDNSFQALDNEKNETDKEIEDFKRFYFMSKPLVNRLKVPLKECI